MELVNFMSNFISGFNNLRFLGDQILYNNKPFNNNFSRKNMVRNKLESKECSLKINLKTFH